MHQQTKAANILRERNRKAQEQKQNTSINQKSSSKSDWKGLLGGLGLLAGGALLIGQAAAQESKPLTYRDKADILLGKLGEIELPDDRWTIYANESPERIDKLSNSTYSIGTLRYKPHKNTDDEFWEDITVYCEEDETVETLQEHIDFLIEELKDEYIDTMSETIDLNIEALSEYMQSQASSLGFQIPTAPTSSQNTTEISGYKLGSPEHSLIAHFELGNIVGSCEYNDGYFTLTPEQVMLLWKHKSLETSKEIDIPVDFYGIPIGVSGTSPLTNILKARIEDIIKITGNSSDKMFLNLKLWTYLAISQETNNMGFIPSSLYHKNVIVFPDIEELASKTGHDSYIHRLYTYNQLSKIIAREPEFKNKVFNLSPEDALKLWDHECLLHNTTAPIPKSFYGYDVVITGDAPITNVLKAWKNRHYNRYNVQPKEIEVAEQTFKDLSKEIFTFELNPIVKNIVVDGLKVIKI